MVQIDGADGLFVPTGADDRWIYAREWHPRAGDDPAAFTPARCVELLRIASGVPDLDPDLISVMPFTMGGHVAQAFRAGRAFLVGDAAHRTTPVGGTGMNTAIHAAHNLGWKLGWVVRGLAGDALLDSYEPERRPIGTENVVRSLRRGEPAGDGLSWDVGVRYSSDVLAAGADGPAQPGDRAPHARVVVERNGALDAGPVRRDADDPCGDGGGRRRSTRCGRVRHGSADPGARPVSDDLADPDGEVEKRYGLGPRSVVLVRPDGYIAWRGDAGE